MADAVVPGITGELARSGSPADFADAVERAACLELSGIDRWLQRFSVQESGLALEHFIMQRLGARGGAVEPIRPVHEPTNDVGAA